MKLRWEDYLLFGEESFHKFWKKHQSKERDILFILGRGFDPRMCLCSENILKKAESGIRDFILIQFDEGKNSPSTAYRHDVEQNQTRLEELVQGNRGKIQTKSIKMEADDGYRIGPREVAGLFQDFNEFRKYSDIVIDISSLPLDIYMPLIGKILFILDSQKSTPAVNLHIVVAESTKIDADIKKSGLSDEASFLHGLAGDLGMISTIEDPTVWIPILGEGIGDQIERIENLVSAREVCPVLPFPSKDPRRGDDIMLEYRELMERLAIENRNIIYAAEQNPFETYREIYKTIKHYRDSLKPIGNCKIAISALSSKLISLGAFLVAYEEGVQNKKNVGIAYVDSQGYEMKKGAGNDVASCELFSLWIYGECYESNI